MPEARPASSGRALEIAAPRDGMNARDIPSAATRNANSTSAQYMSSGRISDSRPMPAAKVARPVVTTIAFTPPHRCRISAY
jgi:hypothetical protein